MTFVILSTNEKQEILMYQFLWHSSAPSPHLTTSEKNLSQMLPAVPNHQVNSIHCIVITTATMALYLLLQRLLDLIIATCVYKLEQGVHISPLIILDHLYINTYKSNKTTLRQG